MATCKLLILATLFAMSAISLGCREERLNERKMPEIKRQLKEPWHEAEFSVVLHGEKTPIRVKGRKATYEIELEPGKFHSTTVISFVAPRTGHPWLGPDADYYLERDAGIQGIKLSFGSLLWYDSLVNGSKATPGMSAKIDDLVVEFDHNVTNDKLLEEEWARDDHLLEKVGAADDTKQPRRTHPREVIDNPFFFAAAPMSSQLGSPKIIGIGIDEGLLKIDMTSQTGVYKATAWVDIKTRKAVKAEFDEFTFPK